MSVTYPAPVHTIYVPPAKRDCPQPHLPCPYVSNEGWRCGRMPHKCPVCEGSGTLSIRPDHGSSSATFDIRTCHACNGTGIVWG